MACSPNDDFRSWLVVITGASRGFGQAIATGFANRLIHCGKPCECTFILGGRDKEGIKETEKRVLSLDNGRQTFSVLQFIADLSVSAEGTDTWLAEFDRVLGVADIAKRDKIFLFLNHGSIGKIDYLHTLPAPLIQRELNVNLLSVTLIMGRITSSIKATCDESKPQAIRYVNISSKLSQTPMSGATLYCATRAGRDAAIRVAHEELRNTRGFHDFKTLNWAPGPMKTKMVIDHLLNSHFESIRTVFQDIDQNKNWVQVGSSVASLLLVLAQDRFQSGEHVDYYEVNSSTGVITRDRSYDKRRLSGLLRKTRNTHITISSENISPPPQD